MRPFFSTVGIAALVDRLAPRQHERDDGISHGRVVEALVSHRLISRRHLWHIELGTGGIEGGDERLPLGKEGVDDGWGPHAVALVMRTRRAAGTSVLRRARVSSAVVESARLPG